MKAPRRRRITFPMIDFRVLSADHLGLSSAAPNEVPGSLWTFRRPAMRLQWVRANGLPVLCLRSDLRSNNFS
jgi:hypothetical protein